MTNKINRSGIYTVLFVCLGNICRSPIAEGVFKHLIEEKGLSDSFACDSCGTSSYHEGEPPHAESQRVTRYHSIDISSQKSRPLSVRDLQESDLIVAMDQSNKADIIEFAKRHSASEEVLDKIVCLRQYENGPFLEKNELNVPDPFFGSGDGFDLVYNMIYCCCCNLFEWIDNKR